MAPRAALTQRGGSGSASSLAPVGLEPTSTARLKEPRTLVLKVLRRRATRALFLVWLLCAQTLRHCGSQCLGLLKGQVLSSII